MRIAIITKLNGGVGTFVSQLVKELSLHEDIESIDIFAYSDDKLKVPFQIPDGKVKIVTNGNRWSFLPRLLLHIPSLRKYDVIHHISSHVAFFLVYYTTGRVWRIPIVSTNHAHPGFKISEGGILGLLGRIEDLFLKFVIFKSKKLVVMTETVAKRFIEMYGVKPIVVYHGVDREHFKFDRSKREKIREKLKLNPDTMAILFVGKLWPHKDVLTLIEAVPKILRKCDNLKVIIIGDGPMYNDMIRKIEKLGIGKHVIVKKFAEDVTAYYSGADIFVMPSVKEEFGLVYVEAMACGLPVIATNGHVVPEIVGDAGLLFEPGNSNDLADKIIGLVNDRELYEELKKKSLERAKQFSWKKAAEQYCKIYKEALGGK